MLGGVIWHYRATVRTEVTLSVTTNAIGGKRVYLWRRAYCAGGAS